MVCEYHMVVGEGAGHNLHRAHCSGTPGGGGGGGGANGYAAVCMAT